MTVRRIGNKDPLGDIVKQWRRLTSQMDSLQKRVNNSASYSNLVVVSDITDFPAPVGGVITLLDNVGYFIDGDVDIGNNRIVCADNTAIIGISSEISYLHNSLDSAAMITSGRTITCFNVSFYTTGTGATILDLDATTSPYANNAIDWKNVNFSGGDVGTIKQYSNVILQVTGYIDKTDLGLPALGTGLIFDGQIATVAIDGSIFPAIGSGKSAITFASTFTATRRVRITDSAIIAASSGVGINRVSGSTFPEEGFILINSNFSGGATYLSGIDYTDAASLIEGCRGITNSYVAGYCAMIGNTTATTISATSTPVKAAGTTVNSAITSKFTHSSNRLTYDAALSRLCKILISFSLTSGTNHQVSAYIAKNGTVIAESESPLTTNASGRLESGVCQAISLIEDGDYFEFFVENNTLATDITVEYMNFTILAV